MKKHETYSSFLKADHLSTGPGRYKTLVVTINAIETHTFEDDGKKQRVISFDETSQPLGLNLTNWDSVAEITGEDDDDNWIGKKIELYVDPRVKFGARTLPAIRIRAVGGGRTSAPDDDTPPVPEVKAGYDKKAAWANFCATMKAQGKGPDPELWKSLIVARMNEQGKEQDGFTAADWKAVAAGAVVQDDSGDDLPF